MSASSAAAREAAMTLRSVHSPETGFLLAPHDALHLGALWSITDIRDEYRARCPKGKLPSERYGLQLHHPTTLKQALEYGNLTMAALEDRNIRTCQNAFLEYYRLVFGYMSDAEMYGEPFYAIAFMFPYSGLHAASWGDLDWTGDRLVPKPQVAPDLLVYAWLFETNATDQVRRGWVTQGMQRVTMSKVVRVGVPRAAMALYYRYKQALQHHSKKTLRRDYETSRGEIRRRMAQLKFLEKNWQCAVRDTAHFGVVAKGLSQCHPGMIPEIVRMVGAFLRS